MTVVSGGSGRRTSPPRTGPPRPPSARSEQLLDAADRVVRREGPEASMNAIAAEAGITKPILYRWFGDKEGLYGQLAERHTGVLLSHLRAAWDGQGDRAARTAALVRAYLEFAESSPEVYLFLVAAQDSAPEAALTTRLSDLLGEALAPELGLAGPSALTRTWATAMVGALQAATARWLRMRDLDRDALADQLSALLCHGWAGASG